MRLLSTAFLSFLSNNSKIVKNASLFMDAHTINCCHHHLQVDVETTASLDQLRECYVSHNSLMLVLLNKDSISFPVYIRFGVIILAYGYFITFLYYLDLLTTNHILHYIFHRNYQAYKLLCLTESLI